MGEVIAVRKAVMIAAASTVWSLLVLSDSQVLITLMRAKESRPKLFDIYHFSLSFDVISFSIIGKADLVAKTALPSLNLSSRNGV